MAYEWTNVSRASANEAGHTTQKKDGTAVYAATASDWKYFNSPEDGARATKGWFKVVAPEEDNDNVFNAYNENWSFAYEDADDETERWYYADGDGELYAGQIKKIKGKYYAFRPEGSKAAAMLTGLVLMRTDGDDILDVLDDDVDADDLDKIISDNKYGDDDQIIPADATLFYFGNDEDHDGAMKTGNVTVNLDGETHNFKFSTTGGAEGKGKGITGIEDKKYVYKYGLRLKASSDDKYLVVFADNDTASSKAHVAKIDSQELRDAAQATGAVNKDGDSVKYLGYKGHSWNKNFKLLTTSGTIVKNKTAAKDGADWYFYVDDEYIAMYVNTKTLTSDKDHPYAILDGTGGLNSWKHWADDGLVDITVDMPADSEGNNSFTSMNGFEDDEHPELEFVYEDAFKPGTIDIRGNIIPGREISE